MDHKIEIFPFDKYLQYLLLINGLNFFLFFSLIIDIDIDSAMDHKIEIFPSGKYLQYLLLINGLNFLYLFFTYDI